MTSPIGPLHPFRTALHHTLGHDETRVTALHRQLVNDLESTAHLSVPAEWARQADDLKVLQRQQELALGRLKVQQERSLESLEDLGTSIASGSQALQLAEESLARIGKEEDDVGLAQSRLVQKLNREKIQFQDQLERDYQAFLARHAEGMAEAMRE
ncbi:hypothetical protein BJ085DRAFT_40984 [Dimargaris cristalligena]|uniref:Uncharacterized protein n=1 Tax=Dimargaris cristalligena TaxID=215637 RepID=A0A4Q0A2T0_9FUNG|nr:hypothetical protein BJ085DRAFT_40984 [Dimargaris cristalligena]|eukprot:RKP39841.1 hypothetical protein BJ085DRAFT_40984 [Dimargaris cristalligena]